MKLDRKQIIFYAAAAAAVVVIAVLVYLDAAGHKGVSLQSGEGAVSYEIKPTDQVHGSPNAPVTLIEYASMTCPHCAAFQKDVVPQLVADYVDTGKVKLIFREYPLDGAARLASALARCETGDKFFSFIDLLFRNQDKWIHDFNGDQQITREDIVEGLQQMGRFAGMSSEQVESCIENKDNLAIVDANWQEAQTRYGVDSTPTFVIAGQVRKGEMTYDALKKILDPLLANK